MRRVLCLLLSLIALTSCQKKRLEFPFVQKYQSQPGDLFYLKPDGQFVLLERRKAQDIRVAPTGEHAQAFPDRITISRRVERKPGDFWGASGQAPDLLESSDLVRTPV